MEIDGSQESALLKPSCIPLPPMITGQPLRAKYLQRALAEMKKDDRVWLTTGSKIIDAYEKANPVG